MYVFNKRIYCSVIALRGSFRGFCYSSIGFSIHRPLVCTFITFCLRCALLDYVMLRKKSSKLTIFKSY